MEKLNLLLFASMVLCLRIFGQCPESGMKFQGPLCEMPTNAAVKEVTCTSLEVKWNGSNNQTYTVEASHHDPSTNSEIMKVTPSEIHISCNGMSHCSATIPVKEGVKVIWSVQARCKNGIYSDVLKGPEVNIPFCIPASTIHVYPNPTTGMLTVEYMGNHSGVIQFVVYDMQGKMSFSRMEHVSAGVTTSYQFDFTTLAPGIYLLEARNEEGVKQVKFMIE